MRITPFDACNTALPGTHRLPGHSLPIRPEHVPYRHPREAVGYCHQRLPILVVEPEHREPTTSSIAAQRGNTPALNTATLNSTKPTIRASKPGMMNRGTSEEFWVLSTVPMKSNIAATAPTTTLVTPNLPKRPACWVRITNSAPPATTSSSASISKAPPASRASLP